MSMFDEERKRMGLPTLGGSGSSASFSTSKSIFDEERKRIFSSEPLSTQMYEEPPRPSYTPMQEQAEYIQSKTGVMPTFDPRNSELMKQASNMPDKPSKAEYTKQQREEAGQWFDDHGLGWLRKGVLDPFAGAVDWLSSSNPVGRFVDRSSDSLADFSSGKDAPYQKQSTGSKIGDKAADVTGVVGSFFAPIGGEGAIVGNGIADAFGLGVNKLRAMTSKAKPFAPDAPTLYLPEPRARGTGPLMPNDEPIIAGGRTIYDDPDLMADTFGLPAPDVLPPTRAKLVSKPNVYEQKYNQLIEQAQRTEFTPGREYEELEQLWSRMAGKEDPSFDELIQLAYPNNKSKLAPDSLSKARELQRKMDVYGVPGPVKSMAVRYNGGVFGEAVIQNKTLKKLEGTLPTFKKQEPKPLSGEIRIGASSLTKPIGSSGRLLPTEFPTVKTFDDSMMKQTSTEFPTKQTKLVNEAPNDRGFITTLKQSEKTPQGLIERLSARYEPITNQKVVDLANNRINKDLEEAASFVMGKSRFTAEKVTTAHRLIDEFNKVGNFERAADIAEKIAEEGTRAGQSIQAFSIYNRLTPEGVLVHAQRIARKTNEALSVVGKEVQVTGDMAAQLTDLAGTVQKMTGVKDLANDVVSILDRAKAGAKLSEDEASQLRKFVEESRQFVKEVAERPKTTRTPKQPSEKRIRQNVVSFLDKQEQAAKERLRSKGIRISSTPIDVWADYAIIGAAKIGKGAVRFVDWSEQMIKDFGDEITPHLENLYVKAMDAYEMTTKKITDKAYERASRAVSSIESKEEINELSAMLSEKVKSVIEKTKNGVIDETELQEIRDLSDELADILPEQQLQTLDPEKRYAQAVKSLSKKLAGVESEKIESPTEIKEIQKLIRTIGKLSDEGVVKSKDAVKIDSDAIEQLGYDLMGRTKPRILSSQEKLAEKLIRKAGSSLGESQIDSIRQLAQQVSDLSGDAKRIASQDLQAILQTLEKSSVLSRVSSVQTMAQLLNPKTLLVRNPLGNELFYRVERLNKLIASPIDFARVKLLGGQRAVTFRTHNQGQYWKNWMTGLRAGWKGVNPDGLHTQYDLGAPAFNGKWNPLTYMEKALGASLKSFDYAAYKRVVNNTIGELATLRAMNEGLTGVAQKEAIQRYIRDADEHLLSIADQYGKYVTFQDMNVISRGLTGLKRGLNFGKDFGFGDMILKYPKTPGAILMRALEYSPAGILRSATIAAKPLWKKGSDPNTPEAMMALTRAITGTMGLSGLGWFMFEKNIITGSASKDRDIRDLEKSAGKGQYQVNTSALVRWVKSGFNPKAAEIQVGDTLYTYDWMQPISIAVSMGANANKSASADESKGSALLDLGKTAYNSLEGGVNSLVEQSVLSGVKRAFEGYPGQTVMDKITDILSEAPASFVPTASNQVKQLTDNARRETYSPDKFEQSMNKAKARVPGLAGTLPQQYDTLGKPKETFQKNSLFNVLLNPGFSSKYELSPEARMIVDLIAETGDESLAPRVPSKSLTYKDEKNETQTRKLTTEEYARMQQLQGEQTQKLLSRILPNSSINTQVKKVKDGLTNAGDAARSQIKKEIGVR